MDHAPRSVCPPLSATCMVPHLVMATNVMKNFTEHVSSQIFPWFSFCLPDMCNIYVKIPKTEFTASQTTQRLSSAPEGRRPRSCPSAPPAASRRLVSPAPGDGTASFGCSEHSKGNPVRRALHTRGWSRLLVSLFVSFSRRDTSSSSVSRCHEESEVRKDPASVQASGEDRRDEDAYEKPARPPLGDFH